MSVNQVSTSEYNSQVVTEAVKKLYLDEKTSDVHFIFKSGERVPAHKNLLAAASDVIDAMFYGSIKENGDVEIDDASAVGFVEFLQFFYSNTIKLTMANIGDVMNLGHKYNITECFNLCVRFLVEHLSTNNVCQVHSLAVLFEQSHLKAECEDLISFRTEEVLQSPSFLESDRNVLDHILKLDEMSCSETVVFKALMSWVKAASKEEELTKDIIQTHLGDFFHEIRFRSMEHDEFVDLLPSFGKLFTEDEYDEILQMIQNKEFQPKIFNALPRIPITLPWNEQAVVVCNRLIDNRYKEPYYIQSVETTTFTTNKPLLLGYFECVHVFYNYRNGILIQVQQPIPVNVTIIKVQNRVGPQNEAPVSTVLHAMKEKLTSSIHLHRIMLSKPILINPNFKYEIRMNMHISEDYAVSWEMKSEVQLQNDIIVTFHNDPSVNGEKRGLIVELGFNQLN